MVDAELGGVGLDGIRFGVRSLSKSRLGAQNKTTCMSQDLVQNKTRNFVWQAWLCHACHTKFRVLFNNTLANSSKTLDFACASHTQNQGF